MVVAERADGSFGFVKVVARWIEVEFEELDEPGELVLWIGDEFLVMYIEDGDIECLFPVLHHAIGQCPGMRCPLDL